jgi:hypothetical protein
LFIQSEQRWLAGYTINIYSTTSRLLINGNGANHFIAKDIPSIQKIVLKGLHEQGVKGLRIEELFVSPAQLISGICSALNDFQNHNKYSSFYTFCGI